MKILIKAGRIIDPANHLDQVADLYITDGRIVAIDQAPAAFTAEQTIDATGCIVCPGFVDLRAHFREPGLEHKATIASESLAAAHSGITTLCHTPDTTPVIDTPAVASLIQRHSEDCALTNIVTLGALTQGLKGSHLSEMAALKDAGCIGVSNARHPVKNMLIMRRAMEYAASHNLTVFINAEEAALVNNGCIHEGMVGTRLGLPGIPEAAETVAVAGHLALIEQTGVRVHFSLISTQRAAKMISDAIEQGLPVTADTSAHHLHLTELDVLDFDSQCHIQPPLRTQRDRDGLRQYLSKGIISAICSDHQPHEEDAKLSTFSDTASGISALESLLPLSLKLVDEGLLSLSDMIANLTIKPARILNIDAGTLTINAKADVCIFDSEQYWTLNKDSLMSQGHNTPFLNWELKGRVNHTLLGGQLVFQREITPHTHSDYPIDDISKHL